MTHPTPEKELRESQQRKLTERMVRDWNQVFDRLCRPVTQDNLEQEQ